MTHWLTRAQDGSIMAAYVAMHTGKVAWQGYRRYL